MKIGVISDTHSLEVPKKILTAFKKVDLIVHAGDFCDLSDYNQFSALKETKAVFGNMDNSKVRKVLSEENVFQCEDVMIGVYHGHGPARGILEAVKEKFSKQKLDVIIFGHSHVPFNEKIGKTLFFNPGSPNDKITAPYCSYGLLEISGPNVSGKIIKVN